MLLKEIAFYGIHYKKWYRELIRKLLFDRIRDHKDRQLHFIFEQNDIETKKGVSIIIRSIIDNINKKDKVKLIAQPSINFSDKSDDCLSLSDYVCGIFKAHYENLSKSNNMERRNFERIRGKIRVIHNLLTDEFYTRRNPFP